MTSPCMADVPVSTRRRMLGALLGATALGSGQAWGAICTPADASVQTTPTGGRRIEYGRGQSVTVPVSVTRVATAWEAQNAILAMLGYGDRIVATTPLVRSMAVFQRFVPSISGAALATSAERGGLNLEALLQARPDVLFLSSPPPDSALAVLGRAGIAVAVLPYNALDAVIERTLITGLILGKDAWVRACDYAGYVHAMFGRIRTAVAQIAPNDRLRIYHALGSPTRSSGRPSLNQDWMDVAAAHNVAENWFQGQRNATGEVDPEQIVQSKPDVIIALTSANAQDLLSDPRLQQVPAVRNRRVYVNPKGMFWWGRETSEAVLQPLWLATLLYPQCFPTVDLNAEVKAFYAHFYGYTLDDATVASFLAPA